MHQLNFINKKGLRQLAKKYLTLSLTCILAFSPCIASSAKDVEMTNSSSSQTTNTNTESYEQTKKIAKKAANTLIMQYNCTSVQYAVIHRGQIVLSDFAGSADKKKKKAPTKDTIYGIGSISKMFTTVAIMQLVEKGVLELDKPVVNYIPDFKMADERYKDITVRMLINHSSGLMGNLLGNTMLFYDPDSINTDNLLEHLSTQRLKAAPGSFSVYSNDGFTLAEVLIERVTKSSYTDYITDNICKPLGLANTKSPQSGFPRSQMAKEYIDKNILPPEYANFIGAGGLYSTAEDLCHFLDMFMTTNNVLSKKSIEVMAQPEYQRGLWGNDGDNVLNYGLGWDCVNLYPYNRYHMQAFEKGGDTVIYHGCVVMVPDSDYGVAVLTVGGASNYNQAFCNTILLNAMKEQLEISEILPDQTGTVPNNVPMPNDYKQYEGYYVNNSMMFKVDVTDNNSIKIHFNADDKDGTELYYDGDGIFKDDSGIIEFSFKKLKNQKTYVNLKSYNSMPGLVGSVTDILLAQKTEENKVSDYTKAAWNARLGKRYYILNEKYSSEELTSLLYFAFSETQPVEGYIDNNMIIDANHLEARIEIPMDSGRDLIDYSTFTKDGIEYLQANSFTCIEEKGIKNLPASKKFNVTIGSDGYARYYNIPTKGKKLTLTIPKNACVIVYDSDDDLTYISSCYKNRTIELPKGGKIVFAGDPSAKISACYE